MLPGHLLHNRYRIENFRSAGRFGKTYLAVDEQDRDKRQVIVKHLKPHSNAPDILETARRLFETEAVTLTKLAEKTDFILTLYAHFEEDREFYLVQEVIEGQTLTQELGSGQLSEVEMLKIVREILAILAEVHIDGIVHGDLKSDNIIRRSRDRRLVSIDFGTIKAVRQIASLQLPSLGSPITGDLSSGVTSDPTRADDIHAVGAIALQCLTGQLHHHSFDLDTWKFQWQHLYSVSVPVANLITKMLWAPHRHRDINAMALISAIDLQIAPAASIPTVPLSAPVLQLPLDPNPSNCLNPTPMEQQIARQKLISFITNVCTGFMLLLWILRLLKYIAIFESLKLPPQSQTRVDASISIAQTSAATAHDYYGSKSSHSPNRVLAQNKPN